MKHFRTAILFALGLALGAWFNAILAAHAQGAPSPKGLFAEVSTQVDGASVRRIRDREEDVVCYVATGQTKAVYQGLWFPAGPTVSISCVRLTVVNP